MSSFKDLVKKANAGKQTTKKKEEDKNHSSFVDLVKKTNANIKSNLTEDEVSKWSNSVGDIGKRAYNYLATDGYKKADTALAEEINKHIEDSHSISQYLRANKNRFKNYDEIYNGYIEQVNYLKDLQKSITDSNEYFSKFKTEKEYEDHKIGWLNPEAETNAETASARQERYRQNEARLKQMEEDLPWYAATIMPDFMENWFLSDEDEKKKVEYETLKAENNQYKRTQSVLDEYYTPETPEFLANGAERNYTNASKEDLQKHNAAQTRIELLLADGNHYYDSNANIVNATTKKIDYVADDLTRAMYAEATGSPTSGGFFDTDKSDNATEQYYNSLVQDKLGMFLSASDDDVATAYSELASAPTDVKNTWARILQEGDQNAWKYLEEHELNIYYNLYKTQGQTAAYEYLDKMATELTRRETVARQKEIDEASWLEQLWLNAKSVPQNVFGGALSFVEDAANMVRGEDINPYSRAHSFQNDAQYVRQVTAQEIDEATGGMAIPWLDFSFGDAYQALMSAADSTVGVMMGGTTYGTFMGMGAASSTMKDLWEKGADAGQMFAGGILSGAAEMIFEKYSIDKLVKIGDAKTISQVIFSGLKQGGIEASEEMLTEIANTVTNSIVMGSQSDWVDAETFAKNVVKAGLSGFISGKVMGGVTSAINYNVNKSKFKQAGADIIEQGATEELLNLANEMAGVTGDKTLFKYSDKAAVANQNKAGSKKAALEVGRTSALLQDNITEQNQGDIQDALIEKGLDKKDAKRVSEYLASTKELTEEQIAEVKGNENIKAVAKELLGDPESKINERQKKYIAAKLGVKYETNVSNITTKSGDIAVNTEVDVKDKVSAEGKTLNTKSGEIVNIRKFDSITNDGEANLTLDDGMVVKASDLSFGSEAEALFVENIGAIKVGKNPISTSSANALYQMAMTNLKSNPNMTANEATSLIKGLTEAYVYGTYNLGRSKLTARNEDGSARLFAGELSQETRSFAYDLGTKDAVSKTEADQKVIDDLKAKADPKASKKSLGKVIFEKGADVDEATLTKTQKSNLDGIKLLAEMSSVEFHIFRSERQGKTFKFTMPDGTVTSANGWFVAGTNQIWIDLNAGNSGEGTMVRTAAHEISHYIKEKSPKQWRAMADLLMKSFAENGVDTESMLNRQIAKIKRRYTKKNMPSQAKLLDMAYEELVCDAFSDMLTDGSIVNFIAEVKAKDRNLAQKILDAIKNLLKKWGLIIDDYKGRSLDTDEAQALSQLEDTFKKLQEMYQEAFMDANETVALVNDIANIDADSKSVSPMMSERTWTESEYVTEREKTAKAISSTLGVDIKTAYKYIDDINSVARLIADDRVRLDYDSNIDESATVLKKNSEYKYSVDMSTLCAKRLLTTGTFDAIQRKLPNTVFSSEDIVALREMMLKRGYEVACGICYVESTRREMGRITQDFIDSYIKSQKTGNPITRINSSGQVVDLKKTKDEKLTTADKTTDKFYADKNYTPTLADLNTTDVDLVKKEHPLVYEAYLNFMNARGQAKPKLLETRAEYKGEILKHFKSSSAVNARNRAGGLRLQSFSDFEIPHLIDMMQIVMDMSRVGLKSQAYTKVPAFAEVFGNTGVKINLSLIAKGSGLDANGNLIFDDVEGINHEEAFKLRDKFSKNVGTILVGKTDAHIIAAMADPRIDYIIPFHKSSWKESLYEALGLTGYADYTDFQNEKPIDKDRKIKNFDPSEYWDFTKSGDENAQIYLEKCREDGRIPKFPQFQGYPGYWKLLIDFKMYDNDGVGSPQEVVRPTFETEASEKILNEYKGGHRNFPVAKDVVEDFVNDYVKNAKFSERETNDFADDHRIPYTHRADQFSYETLTSKPNMKVTTVGGKIPTNRADVVVQAKKNAASVGKFNKDGSVSVYVNDVGAEVVLATKGLSHGLRRIKRAQTDPNFIVTLKAGEIIKNSIKINEILPSKEIASGSYVLIGVANNTNGDLYIVRSVVNQFNHELNSMDVLYAINAKKEEPAATKSPRLTAKPLSVTGSAISISDLLDYVNKYFPDVLPESVLKHYGYTERPSGDFSENVLFSERDTEGNKLSEGQQNFFANSKLRDEQGRLLRLFHGTRNGGFTNFTAKYSDDGITLFLTPSRELAGTYTDSNENVKLPEGKKGLARMLEKGTDKGKGQSGIYEVYANAKNPYVMDCGGESWNKLPFKEKLKGKTILETENQFDYENNVLKTKAVIDGKTYEKTFDLNHLVEKTKKSQEHYPPGVNKERQYKFDFFKQAKPELLEYFQTFASEEIASELASKTQFAMEIHDGIVRTSKSVIDNKTGETEALNTRLVSKWAKDNGYDSVVFQNVRDVGTIKEDTNKELVADVVVVFDGSQIKSVDNLNPTKNKDIRYSDRDTLGNELSNEQIEYFKDSKVRDENGNLLVVYHGTPKGDFNTFRISDGEHSSLMSQYGAGYYFDTNRDSAKRYTKLVNKVGSVTNPKVYEVYLNITNPLEITDTSHVIKKEQLADVIKRGNYEWFFTNGMPFELKNWLGKTKTEIQQMSRDEIINHWVDMTFEKAYFDSDILSAMVKAYKGDSILTAMKEVFGKDGVKVTDKYGEMWVAWDNSQIKETTNKNPTTNPDIRYSERDTSTSNRSILANALEGASQNDIERNKLAQYKEKISLIETEEKRLSEIQKKLFTKGAVEPEQRKDLQFEAKQIANRINTYDRQLLRLEATTAIKNVLNREKALAMKRQKQKDAEYLKQYKEKVAKTQRELLERHQESRKKAIEGREAFANYRREALKVQKQMIGEAKKETRQKISESRSKTEMRHKIKKVVGDLRKLLNRGTKERNVKLELQDAVGKALTTAEVLFSNEITNADIVRLGVESVTPTEEKALNKYAELLDKLDKTEDEAEIKRIKGQLSGYDARYKDLFVRERARLNKGKVSDALTSLANAYADLKNSTDDYVKNNAYVEGMHEKITNLSKDLNGVTIRDMSYWELKMVYDMYAMVKHMVQQANSIFREGKYEDLVTNISNVQMELDEISTSTKDPTETKEKIADFLRGFTWNELKPYAAFERLGSQTFQKLFWDVVEADNVWARDIEEAKNVIESARKKHGFKKWDAQKAVTIKSANGLDFKLTLEDMMSIYAYSKRPQAEDHMTIGGFVFDVASTYKDKKGKFTRTYKHKKLSETYRVDHEVIGAVMKELAKIPGAMQYVDEVQGYLTKLGEKGNEVSRVMYGIDLFKEEAYFPLQSAADYRSSVEQTLNATQTTASLKNIGMSKETVPKANNPIVLKSFDDVVLDHINQMAKYHAYVVPIENLSKVFNNVNKGSGEYISTQALISSKFGESAKRYFNQFITDLNGGSLNGGANNPLANMFATSKAVSVGANLSVVVQQYFAIIRALDEMNPKYFVPFLNGEASKSNEKQYEELKKYAPVGIIKQIGGFDMGANRSALDYIGDTETRLDGKKVRRKVKDAAMWLPGKMDEIGWSTIWRAVKKEIADTTNLKVGTKEFYDACGKRFTEIVAKTQVYDSVTSRSGYMRSKHETVKYLTSFMGEPTAIVNKMFTRQLELHRAIKSKDKSRIKAASAGIARTSTVLILSTVLTSLAKSLPYAMRDDDEEDKALLERWAKHFGEATFSDMNPLNMLPVGRDLVSIWEGWDVERPDTTLISDIFTTFKKAMDDGCTAEEAMDFAGSLSNILGYPLKNVIRDVKGIVRLVGDIADDITPTDIGGAFGEGFMGEDKSKDDRLYDAVVNGDTARIDVLKANYDTDSKYNTALAKAIVANDSEIVGVASDYINEEFASYDSKVDELIALGFTPDSAVKAIKKVVGLVEAAAQAEADGDTETYDEKVQELLELGYDESQLMADIEYLDAEPSDDTEKAKSRWEKDDYVAAVTNGDTTMAEIIKADLIETDIQNGKTEEEAEKSLNNALNRGYKEDFFNGDMSESEVEDWIRELYPDKTDSDVYWVLKEWKKEKEHQDDPDYSYSKYGEYYEAILNGDTRTMNAFKFEMQQHNNYDKNVNKQVASTMQSTITNHFKPIYKKATPSERASLKAKILAAYTSLGYAYGKMSVKIDKWLTED